MIVWPEFGRPVLVNRVVLTAVSDTFEMKCLNLLKRLWIVDSMHVHPQELPLLDLCNQCTPRIKPDRSAGNLATKRPSYSL